MRARRSNGDRDELCVLGLHVGDGRLEGIRVELAPDAAADARDAMIDDDAIADLARLHAVGDGLDVGGLRAPEIGDGLEP